MRSLLTRLVMLCYVLLLDCGILQVKEVRPKAHVFGHVHNSAGWGMDDHTLFINAAQDLTHRPVTFSYTFEAK